MPEHAELARTPAVDEEVKCPLAIRSLQIGMGRIGKNGREWAGVTAERVDLEGECDKVIGLEWGWGDRDVVRPRVVEVLQHGYPQLARLNDG